MKRKIIRVGSSRGVLLPREVTKAMSWDFGTRVELAVDEKKKEVTLKTIKVKIPEDFNVDQLQALGKLVKKHKNLLEDIHD